MSLKERSTQQSDIVHVFTTVCVFVSFLLVQVVEGV